jgi:hypothetical protein
MKYLTIEYIESIAKSVKPVALDKGDYGYEIEFSVGEKFTMADEDSDLHKDEMVISTKEELDIYLHNATHGYAEIAERLNYVFRGDTFFKVVQNEEDSVTFEAESKKFLSLDADDLEWLAVMNMSFSTDLNVRNRLKIVVQADK